MLRVTRRFSWSRQNGLFINSCFAHCQSERQDTWFARGSPHIGNKVSLIRLLYSFPTIAFIVILIKLYYASRVSRILSGTGFSTESVFKPQAVLTLVTKPVIIWFSTKSIILSLLLFCSCTANKCLEFKKGKKSQKLIIIFIHVYINLYLHMLIQFWLNNIFCQLVDFGSNLWNFQTSL